MTYFIIQYVADNVSCAYWQTGERFFRQFENEPKAKRISAAEYFSAYDEYHNY